MRAPLLLLLVGCVSNEELNTECTLVRRDTDGAPRAVTEAELPLAQADYVSFGAAPCTDVCVRGAGAVRTGDNSAPAAGHCSRACSSAGDCPGGFSCRPMLLDSKTMQALCSAEPSRCRAFGGAEPWPSYCVKGEQQ